MPPIPLSSSREIGRLNHEIQAPSESGIRWDEARRFLRSRLAAHLRGDGPETDDLVQEALVRLLRAARSQEVRNLEALMTEIARRTWIDHLRRQRVRAAYLAPIDEDHGEIADPTATEPGEIGDPIGRVRFIVVEFLRRRSAPCHGLALRFFSGLDWGAVALDLGLEHAAVRQQWTRCLRILRREAAGDPGLLRAWAQLGS